MSRTDVLVSTDWAERNLTTPHVVFVEVDEDVTAYDAGHIPGAARPATSYRACEQDRSIRAFRDEVIAAIGRHNLIDVRSPDEFSGKLFAPPSLPQEQPYVAGHVPGALNVPWSTAANDDGTFKSGAELRQIYAGVDESKETIAYCRIGERSSHTWFVLSELLGRENVKNYDGSWTEYGSLVAVPVARGSES